MIEALPSQQILSNRYPSHVLIQFILSGFLRTLEAVELIKTARSTIDALPTAGSEHISQQHKTALLQAAENLMGTFSPFRCNFAWNMTNGLLTTLKNDCTLFEMIYQDNFPEAIAIKNKVAKCSLYGSELREFAAHLAVTGSSQASQELIELKKFETRMIASLKSLGNAIVKSLRHFKTDENVLFFIIRNQPSLDQAFGPFFTAKTIKKMHINLNRAKDFLIMAYQQRGFETLIPTISQKMASLQCTL